MDETRWSGGGSALSALNLIPAARSHTVMILDAGQSGSAKSSSTRRAFAWPSYDEVRWDQTSLEQLYSALHERAEADVALVHFAGHGRFVPDVVIGRGPIGPGVVIGHGPIGPGVVIGHGRIEPADPRERRFSESHGRGCALLHRPGESGSPLRPLTPAEVGLEVSLVAKPVSTEPRIKALAWLAAKVRKAEQRPFRARRARSVAAFIRRVVRMAVVMLRRLLGIQKARHTETFEAVTHDHAVDQHRTRGPDLAPWTSLPKSRELAPI